MEISDRAKGEGLQIPLFNAAGLNNVLPLSRLGKIHASMALHSLLQRLQIRPNGYWFI